jgi:hypothetical protein
VIVDVDVWSGDLYAGTLPPICVLTGQSTPGRHSVRYSSAPRWTIALLFAGVLPYLVGSRLLTRTVTGSLPMCAAALRRFVVQRAATIVIVVIAPLLCLVAGGLILGSGGAVGGSLLLAGFGLVVVGAIGCSIWSGAIGIAGVVEDRPGWGRWVRLRGVNPTFAAAVQHMYAGRMPQWQIGTIPSSFVGHPLPAGYAPPAGPAGWVPPGTVAPPLVSTVE